MARYARYNPYRHADGIRSGRELAESLLVVFVGIPVVGLALGLLAGACR